MSYDTGASFREVKLCLLGDSGVGKSSLVLRFVSDRFERHSQATIGASFMSKTISTGSQMVKFQIWDTAGQEKYKALAPMYYRGATAAIVVYDITTEQSFASVKRWIRELQQLGPANIVLAIAGNKRDRTDEREVETSTGQEYAESIDAIFQETSALTAENVSEMFEEIAKRLPPETERYNFPTGRRSLVLNAKETEQPKKCCNN